MECFSSSCSLMLHDFSLLLREYYVASILSVFFLLTVDFLILNVNFLFLFLLMLVSAEIVVPKFVIWNIVLLSSESSLLFFIICTYVHIVFFVLISGVHVSAFFLFFCCSSPIPIIINVLICKLCVFSTCLSHTYSLQQYIKTSSPVVSTLVF